MRKNKGKKRKGREGEKTVFLKHVAKKKKRTRPGIRSRDPRRVSEIRAGEKKAFPGRSKNRKREKTHHVAENQLA